MFDDIIKRMRRKARTTFGARPTQVLPEGLRKRRAQIPYSWDAPVSFRRRDGEEDKLLPLYRGRGIKSIFDEIELELKLSTQSHGCPTISYGHRLYTVNSAGTDTPKTGWQRTSLFTITSKMTCPSFSLPAGPTNRGGSCVAANTGKTGGKRTPGQTYICDACYSLRGNYQYPNVATAQAARYYWIVQLLEEDPSGEKLAKELIRAIDDFARNATLSSSSEGSVERLTQELGVWDGHTIRVPIWFKAIGETRYMEAVETKLPQELLGVSGTRELFQRRGTRHGEVAGFFRIHDSGGFTPGTKPSLWAPYIRAWGMVAKAYPNVIFWAPVRAYIMPQLMNTLREVGQIPNFVMRPSALDVGEPAPNMLGMAAGTAVAPRKKEGGFSTVTDADGNPAYPCPVYLDAVAHSCMGAGCRACWLAPNTAVAYGFK